MRCSFTNIPNHFYRTFHTLKSNKPLLFEREVEWGDIDSFQVHFRWFESARIEYLLKLKMDAISTKDCVSIILAETSCKYFLPIHFPDRVRVETRTIKLGKTSWILESDVYTESAKGVKVATGTARLDYALKKPVPCPEDVRKEIFRIEEIMVVNE